MRMYVTNSRNHAAIPIVLVALRLNVSSIMYTWQSSRTSICARGSVGGWVEMQVAFDVPEVVNDAAR